MKNFVFFFAALSFCLSAHAGNMQLPITPFSNMASGYQATNPGFRAIIKNEQGVFSVGGKLTIDAVINGRSDNASSGSPYGKLILNIGDIEYGDGLTNPFSIMERKGTLSICMAQDPTRPVKETQCKSLSGNLHPERPFQYLNMPVTYKVFMGEVEVLRYHGNTGEGGTSTQLSLAIFHPAYAFAAPGKSFKDFQSPLVLDLDGDGKMALLNVWDERRDINFDFTASGEKVKTGWVKPSDGILFWDDGSGCVKNGSQLFGDFFGSKFGERTSVHGFEALAKHLDSKATGRVVAAQHPQLKVWRNWGMDGVCRPNEVYPASQFVKEISLAFKEVKDVVLEEDNEVRLTGSYTAADGSSRLIADVYFKQVRPNEPTVTHNPVPYSMSVTNRRPLQLANTVALKGYADTNNFYVPVNLRDGMKVSYSASYGIGGEAGQAHGVLVEDNGRFWFKQLNNPTMQLLLPPGLVFNSSHGNRSLWDIREYTELINRVAFSTPNMASTGDSDVYGTPAVALVDFSGGTAGVTVSYKDAMEVVFNRTVGTRSNSNMSVFYAKGVGPVAVEFREDMSPSGTFKLYIGK